MVGHDMPAATAVELLADLREHGVDACVGGGWAVDALVGQQTRRHSDLDLWLPAADLDPLIVTVAARGLDRLLPWGGDRPWNFVLHDGGSRRLDLHLYELLDPGTVHYGSVTGGHRLPVSALAGTGEIAGTPVRTEDPRWALSSHTGYPPRPVDHHDVALLCSRFGLELPEGFDPVDRSGSTAALPPRGVSPAGPGSPEQ